MAQCSIVYTFEFMVTLHNAIMGFFFFLIMTLVTYWN